MRTTFAEWLASHADEDNAVGDLARDVAVDIAQGCLLPPATPEGCLAHLKSQHYCAAEVVDAVAIAQTRYEATHE